MTTENIPETMRALLYSQPAQTLQLADSWPVPTPKLEEDEHLLKINAIAITKGELLWPFPPESYKDYSPGVESSGTVVVSPPGSKYPAGSKVYMRTTSPRSGSAREYAIALGKELTLQPQNLTAEQAAAVPVSALTAWQALFVQAGYTPNLDESQSRLPLEQRKRILIIGASGSAGLWATQLACAAGFWIAGTCHTRNIDMVRSFGADEIIDYTKVSVRQWIEEDKSRSKFDLVIDCVGGTGLTDAWFAAHPDHGLVLSIVGADDKVLKWTLDRPEGVSAKVNGRFFIMEPDGKQLQRITELIEAGRVKPVVDSEFELKDYKKAFDRVDSGKTTGKVVIRIQK